MIEILKVLSECRSGLIFAVIFEFLNVFPHLFHAKAEIPDVETPQPHKSFQTIDGSAMRTDGFLNLAASDTTSKWVSSLLTHLSYAVLYGS